MVQFAADTFAGTLVILLTPGPVRWKLWMFDLSTTVMTYVPALSAVTALPPACLSVIVNPGPTVPASFGGGTERPGAASAAAAATATADARNTRNERTDPPSLGTDDDRVVPGRPHTERGFGENCDPGYGSGSCARTLVPPPGGLSTSSEPPSAAIRSASPRSPDPCGSAPPRPSSATSTCTHPSASVTATEAREA